MPFIKHRTDTPMPLTHRGAPETRPSPFDLTPAEWAALAVPLSAADEAVARLDERLRISPVRAGVCARADVLEACAAL